MIDGDVKIEIYKKEAGIQGTLDLYASTNFPLAINYGIKNILNIGETTGSYSRTLKIPATKNNNKVLKNIGFDSAINFESLLDNSIQCRISLNNNILLIGSLQVKSITTFEKITEYSITILGTNITWGKLFNDEFMCDVSENFDNDTTHTWSNGFWKDVNLNPNDYEAFCLPVICWGEWKKDKYIGNSNYTKKIDLSEVRPAYFVANLIENYFNKAGYKLESNFFKSDIFKKLIIPTTLTDWSRANELGHANKEVRAEFAGVNLRAQPSNAEDNPFARWIRRWIYHSEKEAWQSGIELLLPFDTETKDLGNDQELATHDYPYTQTLNEGYPINHGHAYDEGLNNDQSAPYHSWVCPVEADYEIRANISVGRMYQSEVYASIIVFRDLTINDNPQKYTQYTNPPLAGNQNPIFRAMCIGNTSHDPEQLASATLNNDLGHLIGQDSIYTQYRHIEYQTMNLNTGSVHLQKGDEVCVYITNLEDRNYLNNLKPNDQMCWVLCEETPEIVGVDQHSRTLKINNYPSSGVLEKTTFEVDRVGRVAYGDKIKMKNFLPCDIPKIDLVKALTGMFNLYWDTNELEKKVTVEPYNTFYKQRTEAVDWSNKLDLIRPQSTKFILDDLGRELYFKYAKDSGDGYVDEIEQELEQEWHSEKVVLQDGFVDELQEEGNEVTAPTYMFDEWEFTKDDTNLIRIPLIISEYIEDVSHSTKPEPMPSHTMRILSYEGMQNLGGSNTVWSSWDWNNNNNGYVNSYPAASSFHETDTSFNNLDYGNRAIPGLYETYWSRFIEKLSASPRIKTVYINLEAGDVSQLDMQKPIFIKGNGMANGQYWILHKVIDYKPSNQESTKVELIQYSDGISNNKIKSVSTRTRIKLPYEGRTNLSTSYEIKKIDGTNSDGYTNEDLILRGNNKHIRNNGNVILGSNLTTRKQNQIVLGQYNKRDDDALFILGGGTSEDDRRNILVVDSSGTLHLGENGGGANMVTKDDNGNIIDLYTETDNEVIIKVIKG